MQEVGTSQPTKNRRCASRFTTARDSVFNTLETINPMTTFFTFHIFVPEPRPQVEIVIGVG